MTWVLGWASPRRSTAIIADMRMSVLGERHDVLQKVHIVGPEIVAAFAGSVRIGFQMIDALRSELAAVTTGELLPQLSRFAVQARGIFKAAPEAERRNKSHLVVTGSTSSDAGCLRLRSPHFDAENCTTGAWHSIGSAEVTEVAKHLAKANTHALRREAFGNWVAGEDASHMDAFYTLVIVSESMKTTPVIDVSDYFFHGITHPGLAAVVEVAGTAWPREMGTISVSLNKAVPRLASWPEVESFLRGKGFSRSGMVCRA